MKKFNLIDLAILLLLALFLVSFFEPKYMLTLTSSGGGDMISHFPTAIFLKNALLHHGKVMFWDMGNYCGFPMFYHYFPLTFVINVLISFIVPMQVAFKLTTVLGTFLLPVCAYLAFRLLKYKFPIPIMAACFSLAFLFLEANSMWGGNIPSTLAGEYSYSLSLSLMILFFGTIFAGISEKNKIIVNAVLFALMALSHGFTFIFSGVIAVFFLLSKKDFWDNFGYLFKVFGLGGLLISGWFIPFIMNIPYVTSYVTRWRIGSLAEVIPPLLIPFFVLAGVALFLNLFDRRTHYFIYVLVMAALLYWLAPSIGMLDIRFVPFIQLFVVLFSATFITVFLHEIKSRELLPFIILIVVGLWVSANVTFIHGWIKWNYEGLEKKATWPLLEQIHNHLRQTPEGRVVYEHSPKHNQFGSERIFENLSHYAGRDTLEGLYMQSSITSPFSFYIQSEVSKLHSGPFPQYKYANLNLPAALAHLKMFNVTQYIAVTDAAKQQAAKIPELKLEKEFKDYQIYRITNHNGRYVEALANEPVLFLTENWKRDFFEWFRRPDLLDTHLIYSKTPHWEKLKLRADSLNKLPRQPSTVSRPIITESIGDESIEFTTNQVGRPHLIKISYHPNWHVEGADKIYLVSPSFMLVYPTQEHVRLYFGSRWPNYLGRFLSLIGLSILFYSGIIHLRNARKA
ncbi:MAG: 6-pyruvoyl-tetrahydropterin synthase-related protein [bacterium]